MFLNKNKYSKNYIGTIIQKIKTVMGYAYEEGKHTNLEYIKNYFAKMTEVVNHPYLDSKELSQIEKLELHQEEMSVSRDNFLIGCNTGLRIGDLLSFIKNPRLIKIKNDKFYRESLKAWFGGDSAPRKVKLLSK
jgi:hypothetical protein